VAIGSVEGFLVALLFVVPGGLGVSLRKNLFSAQIPSAFNELLHALAAALVALLATELAFMLVGSGSEGFGDFLVRPLTGPTPVPINMNWDAYIVFTGFALGLPSALAWFRRQKPIRALLGTLSPHADGLDYLLREALPKESRKEGIWVTVNTDAEEAFLGQLMWRSTAPDPTEMVLSRVRDLNDSTEVTQQEDWSVWIPRDSIRAVWVHIPSNTPADHTQANS
jgi:hypothetical protein